MTQRFHKVISTTTALKSLQIEADVAGKTAVGISPSGVLYIWNKAKDNPDKITTAQAAEFLETSIEQINEWVKSRGSYAFIDTEPPVAVNVLAPVETPAPEATEPETAPEAPKPHEPTVLEKVLNQIEWTARQSVEEIKAEIGKANAPVIDQVNKLHKSVQDLTDLVRSIIIE